MSLPSRIVCLTEETTETLYLLGEQDRIVGVSGYTVRPPEARRKPRVSAFISARFEKIEALAPDLILAFSDLQADIARELVRRGFPVMVFNQRTVAEILQMIQMVGALVGRQDEAASLVDRLQSGLDGIRRAAARLHRHPRVYFEEWDDPLISGIRWVEELIELAGGIPVFPELHNARLAKDRVCDPATIIARDPEIIIASWCGKPVRRSRISGRSGWQDIAAVRDGQIHEIKSALILQPGPAALTDGIERLFAIISAWATGPASHRSPPTL
jgi:iron complex transport system substrate-binding protein